MSRHLVPCLLLATCVLWSSGCPQDDDDASDDDVADDDAGDDDAADDDAGDDDTRPPLEACMDGSKLDYTCDSWAFESAVAGETVGCLAAASPTAEAFFTFWLTDNEPDGTVHVLELRLQDPGWINNNDGDRWVITLDTPLDLDTGDSLPTTITGTAVLDTFTFAAPFSFLEAHLALVEVTLGAPLTFDDLLDGTTLVATVSGAGEDFLVFDGTDDSPDPLDDYEWIVDPTGQAYGCVAMPVTLHPLDVGDP